jgi:hypothetical protein
VRQDDARHLVEAEQMRIGHHPGFTGRSRRRRLIRDGGKSVGHGFKNLFRSGFGAMASCEPFRIVVGEPGLALLVLPDQLKRWVVPLAALELVALP